MPHPTNSIPRRGTGLRLLLVSVLAAALVLPAGLAGADRHVERFVSFDPSADEFPEGITVDPAGDVYLSLLPRDEIRRIDPSGTQSPHATLPQGAAPAGLEIDASRTLYVAASGLDPATFQSDPATRGIYRVDRTGTAARVTGSGAMQFPNDVTLDARGNAYATDTIAGEVWRVPRDGPAERWLQHELLAGDGRFGFGFPIGANGIVFGHNRLFVANTERGLLVEIPINPDGSAGTPTVRVSLPELVGVDGIAQDVHGNVYAAMGVDNHILRVTTTGDVQTLATADDGLSQPSTLAFGSGRSDRQSLFIANFAIFSPEPHPGVLQLRVGVPGQPVH